MYASFLIDVMNRPQEGNLLLKKADEIEDSTSRSHNNEIDAAHGLLSDRVAIISISSANDRIGEIIDLNTGLTKLTGHSKAELINSNISRIIPEPYASHHNSFIKNYLATGTSKMMNSNNFVFALHKNGFLTPVEFFLRVCLY